MRVCKCLLRVARKGSKQVLVWAREGRRSNACDTLRGISFPADSFRTVNLEIGLAKAVSSPLFSGRYVYLPLD